MLKLALPLCLVACALMLAPDRPAVSTASPAPEVSVSAEPERRMAGNGYASVAIERSPDGHFYADALVNGAPVRFMVDTGASMIALNRADAQAAGLQFGAGEFTGTGRGVGGAVALKPVMLDRVRIGAVEARDVEAAIIDSDLNTSLLGQSWLRRVGTVSIEGDRMILR